MKILGLIAVIIIVLAILIFADCFFDLNIEYWQKFEIVIVTLTLIALIIYVYDTNKIAKSAQSQTDAIKLQTLNIQKQLDYIQGASLSIKLDQIYDPSIKLDQIYDPTYKNWQEIKSVILVKNTGKFNVEAKLAVVFKFGDANVIKHTDKYYSGEEIWNISIGQKGSGNFALNDILGATGINTRQFIEKLFRGDLKDKLEVAVFSRIRRYNKNEKFTDNITQFYYMGVNEKMEPSIKRDESGFIFCDASKPIIRQIPVWVWEPKAPPKEMEEIAFNNDK